MKIPKSFWIIASLCGAALIILIIALSVKNSSDNDTRQLQMLHVIFRHGSRTPQSTYPKDPHINETYFPFGWGQLTNIGKRELFETGKFLRERYGIFLGDEFKVQEYYSQSTDVDRTRASVEMINAGLWPPKNDQKWGPLDWQPIPVFAEPLESDSLLLVRKPCPAYHLELRRVLETLEVKKKLEQYQQLFKDLSNATGQATKNFDDVQDIYSTLKAEEGCNLTLPGWTKGLYPEKMMQPTAFSYVLNVYSQKLKRLKAGPLLKKLLDDWSFKVPPKFRKIKTYVLGGHDSTIANLLSVLDVWEPQVPGFGATILLELHRDTITNEYGIEIYYRNSPKQELQNLVIPGCEKFCHLPKLIQLTSNVVPDDWEKECEVEDDDYSVPTPGLP